MHPQLTPEQQIEFENALKIGEILASTVNTLNSPPIRINPQTVKEAVGIYCTLGAKKPFFQSSEQFVMNCVLYNASTFAVCSNRIILSYHLTGQDMAYWYGNGRVKDWEPLENVKLFTGDNCVMIASMLIFDEVYAKLRRFLEPQ